MKKILLFIPLLIALVAVVACSSSSYSSGRSSALVAKIQNGDSLSQKDYLDMIAQSEGALNDYAEALDTMNVTGSSSYDSALAVLSGNIDFVKMVNDCLLFERVLNDAPLDESTRKVYHEYGRKRAEFYKKYKEGK